jgi:hypothetical protein
MKNFKKSNPEVFSAGTLENLSMAQLCQRHHEAITNPIIATAILDAAKTQHKIHFFLTTINKHSPLVGLLTERLQKYEKNTHLKERQILRRLRR